MAKLVVVGAGRAGLSMALFAARRGHKVVVLEKDFLRIIIFPA